jgi:NAD(P)-dependent dehydrogenase (short-subunit alcohol dehydrogenase family)
VGRGIAVTLGQCGATIYVTGRSARDGPTTKNQSETIDETADLVTARGGVGIPILCDHTVDDQVDALFDQVKQDHGRLDILVNNAWGGYEDTQRFDAPFWEQPVWRWDTKFAAGVRAHYTASRLAVPLMLPVSQGLIVNTTWAWPEDHYDGRLVYYLAKLTVNRMVWGMAQELREHSIAAVALSPTGWVWSGETLRAVYDALRNLGGTDALFRERPALKEGESPEYTGRAVAHLAADPSLLEKSGRVLTVDVLAREYGFTDVDGRQPTFPRW